jgi:hypothetical protein
MRASWKDASTDRKVNLASGFNRIAKLVRLIIPHCGILIPRRMAVISFLGGLFPRPPNYVPKNKFKAV